MNSNGGCTLRTYPTYLTRISSLWKLLSKKNQNNFKKKWRLTEHMESQDSSRWPNHVIQQKSELHKGVRETTKTLVNDNDNEVTGGSIMS